MQDFKEIEVLVDWFQVTIFPLNNYKEEYKVCYSDIPLIDRIIPILFKDLFNINSNDIVRELKGFNGYDVRYSYNDISIMINSQRDDMGVNILLTGSGCRDFEELNIGWINLFNKLSEFDINFNRIDIAIDNFVNDYFDIPKLKRYIKKGLCISKFRNCLELKTNKLSDYELMSNTLQFGSKASDIEITFYDKFRERTNAGYIVDKNINFWVRTELRFRHDKAKDIFYLLKNDFDYMQFIFEVLYNYIDFKSINSKDSNISRRESANFWTSFLSTTKKLKLSSKTQERSISKTYNWLLESTSRSQLMVYMANMPNINLDTISIDLLYKYLTTGAEKIKDKDIQLINDYRISKKLVPITKNQLNSYIQDIKDNILE